MKKRTMDETAFRELCEKAWTSAESEGELGHPVNKYRRGIPVLFAIKNHLYKFFGVEDEIEGVYCQPNETFTEAYMRKIDEIMAGKIEPSFDYSRLVNAYVHRAEEKYDDRGRPAEKFSGPVLRGSGKQRRVPGRRRQ